MVDYAVILSFRSRYTLIVCVILIVWVCFFFLLFICFTLDAINKYPSFYLLTDQWMENIYPLNEFDLYKFIHINLLYAWLEIRMNHFIVARLYNLRSIKFRNSFNSKSYIHIWVASDWWFYWIHITQHMA